MKEMFSGCLNIISLNLSGFKTGKVKDMSGMFNGMNKLKTLVLSEKNFDTKNVENMSKMFYGCKALTSLNLSFFNVSKCNNFEEMFGNTSEELISTINNDEILKMISPQIIELLIEVIFFNFFLKWFLIFLNSSISLEILTFFELLSLSSLNFLSRLCLSLYLFIFCFKSYFST